MEEERRDRRKIENIERRSESENRKNNNQTASKFMLRRENREENED